MRDLPPTAPHPLARALMQTYAAALPELSVPHRPDPAPEPRLIALDEDLARELGLDPAELRSPAGLALLTGNLAEGQVEPTAQAYAGHQFGQANPQLGDGRAVLLGEVIAPDGTRHDLHLKGSGPTPFARAGDGKAPLGPMLREMLIGTFLHAAGIPTTRALAVIATGEQVRRRTMEPGAILVREASSHLRVGTFQYAAWHLGPDVVSRLVDAALERHWPQLADEPGPALTLLRAVTRAQARLVARWMLVGFVHGVMNTDNMAISGQSIDFGPCAFLDEMRRDAVFSSIDTQGRYAYGRQPGIALWNLSRFAEALLPVIDPADPDRAVEQATAVLEEFEPTYLRAWTHGMAEKLGIPLEPDDDGPPLTPREEAVRVLGEDALALLEAHRVDVTGFFRALGDGTAGDLFPADPAAFEAWSARRDALLADADPAAVERARRRMDRVNPLVISRNRHVENALRAAEAGDLAPFERLLAALRDPFTRHPGQEDLEGPGEDDGPVATYCGT